MKGFPVAEVGKVVPILYPVSMNGIATEPSYVNMANYSHLDIVITLGATNAGAVTFTVKSSSANSAGTAIAFRVYKAETTTSDVFDSGTKVTDAGFAAKNNDTSSVAYVISIDASELLDGHKYVGLVASGATTSTPGAAVGILSGARYAAPGAVTAK